MVIMLTAYGTVQDAVEAMKLGAYDFLIKSVDLEGIDPVVARVLDVVSLRRRLEAELEHRDSAYQLSHLVAQSHVMKQLLDCAGGPNRRCCCSVKPEREGISGARDPSQRRAPEPFIGQLHGDSQGLFERVFGFERGAFTGANQHQLRLLEKAEGGPVSG
jgi:two-component system response regulator AtoC